MSDLQNFNNIFANIAESAYNDRPNSFEDRDLKNGPAKIDYSQDYDKKRNREKGKEAVHVDGGERLPNEGVVYLQPDETVHEVTDKNGETYKTGLLTDEKAGFNAYFVTDTPELNENTQEVYLAIRGSDAGANDWIGNDINFALFDNYIPQAELASKAIKEEIKQIKEKAPNAELNITGHSLGTMISSQAVAKLYQEDPEAYETIGQVVLFNGPDPTKSLKKMGLTDQEIEKSGEKVVYYVNPLDAVSMLNRSKEPWDQQYGTVNVIVPIHFNSTLDIKNPNNPHDFGEFQIGADGNPLVASESYHPEMLRAGEELAELTDKYVAAIQFIVGTNIPAVAIADALSKVGGTGKAAGIAILIALGITDVPTATRIYLGYTNGYNKILKKAEQESIKWNKEHISDYQKKIRSAKGDKKIELRIELLYTVVQDVLFESEDKTKKVKNTIKDAREDVQRLVNAAHEGAHMIADYLSYAEVEDLLKNFNMSDFYDEGIEEETLNKNTNYQTAIENFAETLIIVAQNIQTVDNEGADTFNRISQDAANN